LHRDYDSVIFADMGLGDLQYLTLLAVARLGDEAVSRAVRDELDRVAGRVVSVSTVFVTLTRLEDQGLLASGRGPVPAGGGRRPRVFELTEAGHSAIREARAEVERMWVGLETP
jgi:DNA-binding PadR family transcriptional regulator